MLMVLNFTNFKKWIIISAFVNLSWPRQILEETSDMSTADQRLQYNTFDECIPQPRFPSWFSMAWLLRVGKFRVINLHFSSQILQLYIKSQLKLEKIEVSTRHGICTKQSRHRRKKWIVHLTQRQIQTLPKAQRTQGLSVIKRNCFYVISPIYQNADS